MPSVPRRPGRPSAEHQAAVARRLELLRAELNASPAPTPVTDDPSPPAPARPSEREPEHDGARAEDDEWWSTATRLRGLAPVAAGPVAGGGAVAAFPADPVHRWRSPVAVPAVPAAWTDAATAVAEPGRHASRRDPRSRSWALVPQTLRGRVSIGPAQLTVVVALLCLGLAALAVGAVRGRPQDLTPVAAPVPVTSAGAGSASGTDARVISLDSATTAPSDTGSSGSADAAEVAGAVGEVGAASSPGEAGSTSVTVDVAGKVRRPGIAVLAPGSRVVDAIEAAGGARNGVDLTSLNLARPLVDGEQVLVGIDPPPGVAAAALASPSPGAAPAGAPGALVDLNTAAEAELDTLPDVGPVTAQAILSWREEHGGFTSVDELLEVDGIGEATLAKLAPLVTV